MRHPGFSYRFAAAIVRQPGRSVNRGIRAVDSGSPEPEKFQAEHRDYILALERAGLKVTVLDALDEYPDSVFIEDAALCLPEGAIMMRPGAPTRTGESPLLSRELAALGYAVVPNDSDGFIDGGDILVTDTAILVGLSDRTNRAGFEWLESVLDGWGYRVLAVQTPGEVLHFKSDCSLLDSDTILATHRLSQAGCFSEARVLTTPRGEEPAANSIRVNDFVLIPAGFPATAEMLTREGYNVETVVCSQASLLDGGLSCMSLRLPLA